MNPDQNKYTFKFLSYYFNKDDLTATFCYQGIDNVIFTENVVFDKNPDGIPFNPTNDPQLNELLDRAVFLAYILSGTSYYKAHPTPFIQLEVPLDAYQAGFFSLVYQEGLSQFAFENQLVRNNLAHFYATPNYTAKPAITEYKGAGCLALESGGKDSLLVSEMLSQKEVDYTPWYVTSSEDKSHPAVIDNLFDTLENRKASICVRKLDLAHLKESGGMNGHVPVTYIIESLALIQAILNNDDTVLTSIGQEGNEAHAMIGDLPVNHQWSKTWQAEQYMTAYINRYISPKLHVGSPIRHMSELRIAKEFVENCWVKYGYQFSSCNRANYTQKKNNGVLSWCGDCAKCANSYLLFCPFLPPQQLQALFHDQDLFAKPTLTKTFKGLLGVDNEMKPFECIGSVDELRTAYMNRMKVDPVPMDESKPQLSGFGLIDGETANNINQAAGRLGLGGLFNRKAKKPEPVDPSQPKIVKLYQPLYVNLPFNVPEGHFDYMADFPSDPYFKDYIESHAGTWTAKKETERAKQRAERDAEARAAESLNNFANHFKTDKKKRRR